MKDERLFELRILISFYFSLQSFQGGVGDNENTIIKLIGDDRMEKSVAGTNPSLLF